MPSLAEKQSLARKRHKSVRGVAAVCFIWAKNSDSIPLRSRGDATHLSTTNIV